MACTHRLTSRQTPHVEDAATRVLAGRANIWLDLKATDPALVDGHLLLHHHFGVGDLWKRLYSTIPSEPRNRDADEQSNT